MESDHLEQTDHPEQTSEPRASRPKEISTPLDKAQTEIRENLTDSLQPPLLSTASIQETLQAATHIPESRLYPAITLASHLIQQGPETLINLSHPYFQLESKQIDLIKSLFPQEKNPEEFFNSLFKSAIFCITSITKNIFFHDHTFSDPACNLIAIRNFLVDNQDLAWGLLESVLLRAKDLLDNDPELQKILISDQQQYPYKEGFLTKRRKLHLRLCQKLSCDHPFVGKHIRQDSAKTIGLLWDRLA